MAVILGAAGGSAFYALSLPLPWLLGALAFTTVAALLGVRLEVPRAIRNAFIPALGVALGGFFDPAIFSHPALLLALLLLVLLYLTTVTGLGFLFFRYLAGCDGPTACFSAVPGGLTEMLVLSEPLKVDVKVVALVHAARLAIVLPLITMGLRLTYGIENVSAFNGEAQGLGPRDAALLLGCAVLGYGLGRRLGLPAPHMFGPLILSVAAHSAGMIGGTVPGWIIALAQVLIGIFIGARFSGVKARSMPVILLWSSAWAMVLLGIVAAFAAGVGLALGVPLASLLIAFAPGGVAEMSVLALAAGASLGLVMTVHFLRVTTTIVAAPLLVAWLRRRRGTHAADR